MSAEPLPSSEQDAIAAETYAERMAQGLPPKITDPRALAQAARLVNQPTQQDARSA